MEILSCNAPYKEGGLGKMLAQLVEEARDAGTLGCYYASKKKSNDSQGHEISLKRYRWLFHATPLRYSLSWREFVAADLFDRAVARRLSPSVNFHGFSGRAQHSFSRARELKYEKVILESPSSHVDHVLKQHQRAAEVFSIEESWLNYPQRKKTLQEYKEADLIYVISEYSRQTFLEAGFADSKLRRHVLTIEPRFAPPIRKARSDRFTVVFVGRFHVSKGVPVLLKAFERMMDKDAELILVGGAGTDGMEKYVHASLASDSRIKIRSGDSLPYLHQADVVVHPSYEDGLGFAPLEALACGVPVIVTEDTGMKEYVVEGQSGYVIPTGDVDALVERLQTLRTQPLVGTFEPFYPKRGAASAA